MKKSSKSKLAAIARVDPYLEGLVAKLIDRLVLLERKMDTVISQTGTRPSSGGQTVQVPPPQASRRDRTMYEAICADCSKVCEVPFRPTEARPVYCKDCWSKRKSGASQPQHGMPVLTPVALPPKPASKLNALFSPAVLADSARKKTKIKKIAKKAKKKR